MAQEAALCLLIIPEPHTRTSKRNSKDCPRRTVQIEDLRNLHTRTCYEHPRRTFIQPPTHIIFKSLNARTSQGGCQQDLHKIFSQGPVQDHALQGPLRGFHQDLYKICAQGTDQDFHAKTPRRISQDHHQGTCCWRGSYKILIEEPLQGLQIHMFSACLVAKFDQKK